MNHDAREKAARWLEYYHSLGLGPFYRDRAARNPASPLLPEETASVSSARSLSLEAAAARAPLPAPVPASVLPLVAAPSLFDAAERVENDSLERIREDIGDCTRCKLCRRRTNIVFGVGSPRAELVFIGEGPGHDEDMQGIPFVGRAGKLLTQMIEAMGLRRDDTYICNVVKCRPPENRLPEKDEIATCSPFLMRQLDVIHPKVIVCLGACAAQTLLNTTKGISNYRGEWFDYRGARLMATYHPAYLLRNPAAKPDVWKDLQKVMAVLGLQPPKKK